MINTNYSLRSVQFGLRAQIKNEDTAAAALVGGVAVSSGATVSTASATGTVGSGLTTGGAGLMLSGPDAAAAKLTLDAMQQMGSQQAVQYSQQNPMAGGASQLVAGVSLISGGGGTGNASRSKSPN